jgi:hypothetical protein
MIISLKLYLRYRALALASTVIISVSPCQGKTGLMPANPDFHAPAVFISKALRGAAVVAYCKLLITQEMNAAGSAQRVEIFQLN